MTYDATIRYVSRYKPQDTVQDTIHKARLKTSTTEEPKQALAPENEIDKD